jgi:hypothetical protein
MGSDICGQSPERVAWRQVVHARNAKAQLGRHYHDAIVRRDAVPVCVSRFQSRLALSHDFMSPVKPGQFMAPLQNIIFNPQL